MTETTTPVLFTPFKLRALTLPNRIVVSPMCQYSARDGCATDWHLQHLGSLAVSNAGLLMIEATAVEPDRPHHPRQISASTATKNEAALRDRAASLPRRRQHLHRHPARPCRPQGPRRTRPVARRQRAEAPPEAAWQTVAPSPHSLRRGLADAARARPRRHGADPRRLHRRRAARQPPRHRRRRAARRARLSPCTSSSRPWPTAAKDEYGGTPEKRMRFPLEVAAALRDVWPKDRPIGARITGSDWLEAGVAAGRCGGLRPRAEAISASTTCASRAAASSPRRTVRPGPGYQVPFAAQVRARVPALRRAPSGSSSGRIRPRPSSRSGEADLVALGRAFLDDPRWVWHAAEALDVKLAYPQQYERANPRVWAGAALTHELG